MLRNWRAALLQGWIPVFLSPLHRLAGRLNDGRIAGQEGREKQYLLWPNMAPHTNQRQLWACTADRGRCCPSSTGTGSAYLACSVNLFKNWPWLNDRGANLILKHSTLQLRLNLDLFQEPGDEAGRRHGCLHRLTDMIRRTYPCDLRLKTSEHQSAPSSELMSVCSQLNWLHQRSGWSGLT